MHTAITVVLYVAASLMAFSTTASAAQITQNFLFFTQQTFGLEFHSEDFSAVPPTLIGQTSYDLGPYSVSSATAFNIASNIACPTTGIGLGKCISEVTTAVTLSFDAPVKAVGFTATSLEIIPQFFIRLDGGSPLVANLTPQPMPGRNSMFIGLFDLTNPFSTVQIISDDVPSGAFTKPNVFTVDNLRYGADPEIVPTAPVPLPAGALLLLSGIMAFGVSWSRQRSRGGS